MNKVETVGSREYKIDWAGQYSMIPHFQVKDVPNLVYIVMQYTIFSCLHYSSIYRWVAENCNLLSQHAMINNKIHFTSKKKRTCFFTGSSKNKYFATCSLFFLCQPESFKN